MEMNDTPPSASKLSILNNPSKAILHTAIIVSKSHERRWSTVKKTTKVLVGCSVAAAIFFGFRQAGFSSLTAVLESRLSRWVTIGDETYMTPVYNGDYRLIFDENFDESPLDPAIWNDQYLASWTPDMEAARAVYEVADGNLNLIINEEYAAVESRVRRYGPDIKRDDRKPDRAA